MELNIDKYCTCPLQKNYDASTAAKICVLTRQVFADLATVNGNHRIDKKNHKFYDNYIDIFIYSASSRRRDSNDTIHYCEPIMEMTNDA